MRYFLPFLTVAGMALAGCQPAVSRPVAAPVADTSPVPAAGELPGEYRVAGIDGAEVSGGIGIALTITDQLIRFDPTCAGFSWTYTYEAGALRTDRPEKPREPGAPYTASIKRPTCRIAVHPEQRRLAAALDAVSEVARTEDNALVLSGGGHSVTLFTQ